MDDFNDDPLDLLEDDGDGVIETILLFDEEEKKQSIQAKTGCVVPLVIIGSTAVGTVWSTIKLFT